MGFSDILVYIIFFIGLYFGVILLITYLEIKPELEKEKSDVLPKKYPSVTIIVPCFNEGKTIEKTVESILALNYPKSALSIFVVNDGSTDNTKEVLKKYEGHPNIKTFSIENGGKHNALNFAIEKTHSEIVACIDADSFVDPQSLRRLIRRFEDPEITAVTATIKITKPESYLQHIQKMEYFCTAFLWRTLSAMNAQYVTPGPFSAYRLEVLKKIGGFRQGHQTEDLEIGLRLLKQGYKIRNAETAYVYTTVPATFMTLYRQRVRWSYGFLNNMIDYRKLFFNKKVGNLGFILPITTFLSLVPVYVAGRMVWSIFDTIGNQFARYQAVGFYLKPFSLHLDWFFLGNTKIWLSMIMIVTSILIIFVSSKLVEGKFKFGRDTILYLTIYVFIHPIWRVRSLISTIFRKQVVWR